MRNVSVSISIAVAACLSASAVFAAQPAAQRVVIDPGKQQRIDEVFKDMDQPGRPGCSLGVMSDGALAYTRGYGEAVLDSATPIDSSKVFELASVSKQFSAASIVLLAQQGKIKLTDDVRKYVPELPSYGKPITINHLLWHTSGLRDYVISNYLAGHHYADVNTKQQVLDLIVRQKKLDFPTGTSYKYSNTGYFLLGLIVERVSGQSLDTFHRENIFSPLGMPNSTLRDKHDKVIPNQALGYAPDGTGSWKVDMSNWEQVGATGVQSSVDELQRWDENFYDPRVGGPAFVKEMLRTGKLDTGRPLIYARGLQVDTYRGLRRVRHGGDGFGYHTNLVRFPDQHTSIALLCNFEGVDQYSLSRKVIDIVLEDAFTKPPEEVPTGTALPAERFAGHYFGAERKDAFDFVAENGVPVLKIFFASYPLVPIGPTTFYVEGLANSRVEFKVPAEGPAESVSIVFEKEDTDDTPITGNRFTPVPAPAPEPFTGTFHSNELGVDWKLAVENGQVSLVDGATLRAIPIGGPLSSANEADAFYGKPGLLQFTRDASGQVNGFNLSLNGQLDIRFDRQSH